MAAGAPDADLVTVEQARNAQRCVDAILVAGKTPGQWVEIAYD